MPITIQSIEEEIMKEMSADMNIPFNTIRDVVIGGQSAFTKHTMESGEFNNVRWPKFGIFKVKPRYVQIKHFMRGVKPEQRFIYRELIKRGTIFPRIKKHSKNVDETLSTRR